MTRVLKTKVCDGGPVTATVMRPKEIDMPFLKVTCLLCSVLSLVATAITCPASDDEPEVQVKARDSIVATVTGDLSTTWNPGELHYACVEAGGTEIELDPADCPAVTRELLEYMGSQGGGFISATQVEAKGYLVFEKRPDTVERRAIARGDRDAAVPVLRVRWIKITTLPLGKDIGPIKRSRDKVTSTTVRMTKR